MTNPINSNSITIDQREFWLESNPNQNNSHTYVAKIRMAPGKSKVYPAISSEQYYEMIMARSERIPGAALSRIKEIKPAIKQAYLLTDKAIQSCPEPIWSVLEEQEKIGLGRSACRHAAALCKIDDREAISELHIYCGIVIRNRQLNKNHETTASMNEFNGPAGTMSKKHTPGKAPRFPVLANSKSSEKRINQNNPNKVLNPEEQFAKRRFSGQIERLGVKRPREG